MTSTKPTKPTKPALVLLPGSSALTVEGMERICKAMTGKPFTAQDRILAQQQLDAAGVPQPGLTRPVKNL